MNVALVCGKILRFECEMLRRQLLADGQANRMGHFRKVPARNIEPVSTLLAIIRAWRIIADARILYMSAIPPEEDAEDVPVPLGSDS